MPRPPSRPASQPASQQASQGQGLARGPSWRGAFFFSFLLPSSRLMGWKSVSGGRQGSSKTGGPVMCCGSLCSQLENRPARLGISHQRRPARYLTAAMQAHAARSTDLVTRPTAPGIPISSLSISHQRNHPRGMTPAWAGPPRRITRAVATAVGFAAGIGMSSRPRPCPPPSLPSLASGLWSLASGLLPVRLSCVLRLTWGIQATAPVSGGSSTNASLAAHLFLLLFPGGGPRQSAACRGGHTDHRQTQPGPEGVATAPLSMGPRASRVPKSIRAMTPAQHLTGGCNLPSHSL